MASKYKYNSGYVYLDLDNKSVVASGTSIEGIYKRCEDVYNSGKIIILVNYDNMDASPYPVMMQPNDNSFDIYGYPVDGYFSVSNDDVIKLITE